MTKCAGCKLLAIRALDVVCVELIEQGQLKTLEYVSTNKIISKFYYYFKIIEKNVISGVGKHFIPKTSMKDFETFNFIIVAKQVIKPTNHSNQSKSRYKI